MGLPKGYKHSPEAIEKIRQASRRPMSEETKRKIGAKNKISLLGHKPWNKGKKNMYSPESINRFSKAKLGKPRLDLRGRKRTLEQRLRMSIGRKGKTAKERHHNWKGGISSELHLLRGTFEYSEWRRQVFRRDGWRCIFCGYRSRKSDDINADHIKRFADYPKLRYDIKNGRTLCVPCHKKVTFNHA